MKLKELLRLIESDDEFLINNYKEDINYVKDDTEDSNGD